jgi:hypothetical protein
LLTRGVRREGEVFRRDLRVVEPLDLKASAIAEETPTTGIAHLYLDAEALVAIVVPFVDTGDAGEGHGKTKAEDAFVEALFAGANLDSAVGSDLDVDVDGKMLMVAEIVDDAASFGAVVAGFAADAFTLACDGEAEPDAGLVEEELRSIVLARKIGNRGEAKIPTLMEVRLLGLLPELVHVSANVDLNIDSCRGHWRKNSMLTRWSWRMMVQVCQLQNKEVCHAGCI